jgi:hypothetical protein
MTPQYELRMIVESTSVWRLEIWQAASLATPRLKVPEHVARNTRELLRRYNLPVPKPE